MILKNFKYILVFSFCYILLPFQAIAETSIEGDLSIIIIDKDDGDNLIEYDLTYEGKRIQVIFDNPNLKNITNGRVILKGNFISQDTFKANSFLAKPESKDRQINRINTILNPKIATILVDFQDLKSSCNKNSASNILSYNERSLSKYIEYSSRNEMKINLDTNNDNDLDIFGPFEINSNYDECNYRDWTDKAKTLAEKSGVDFSAYNIIMYIFPKKADIKNCDFTGIANHSCLGKKACSIWLLGCYEEILIHEFGHTIGLGHASTDFDNNNIIEKTDKYKDYSCPMGFSDKGHLPIINAPHQDQLGWLDYSNGSVKTVYKNGEYSLTPLEKFYPENSNPLLIKIPHPKEGYWYLSYRKETGKYIGDIDFFYNNLSIHRLPDTSENDFYGQTRLVKNINNGETFTDPHTKDKFEVLSTSNQKLTFRYEASQDTQSKCLKDFSCKLAQANLDCVSHAAETNDMEHVSCRIKNYDRIKKDFNISGQHRCVQLFDKKWWDGVSDCEPSIAEFNSEDNIENKREAGTSLKSTSLTECLDTDGDGWGWDGEKSCKMAETNNAQTKSTSNCIDSDGDGWGWDGYKSCRMKNSGKCIDTDGDGWGWDGEKSCRP